MMATKQIILNQSTFRNFSRKILMGMPDGCHYWIGDKSRQGYGYIKIDKVRHKAHRVSYELFRGKTDGLFVCHTCDNPICVNPDHLFLGTNQTNTADKCKKGRHIKGTQCYATKLDDASAIIIREARKEGFLVKDIAKYFNVHANAISKVIHKKTWKHL